MLTGILSIGPTCRRKVNPLSCMQSLMSLFFTLNPCGEVWAPRSLPSAPSPIAMAGIQNTLQKGQARDVAR